MQHIYLACPTTLARNISHMGKSEAESQQLSRGRWGLNSGIPHLSSTSLSQPHQFMPRGTGEEEQSRNSMLPVPHLPQGASNLSFDSREGRLEKAMREEPEFLIATAAQSNMTAETSGPTSLRHSSQDAVDKRAPQAMRCLPCRSARSAPLGAVSCLQQSWKRRT